MKLPTVTVSQLNGYIKKMFDSDLTFASVLLSGEISNFSPHYRTGHLYFSLKDEHAGIKAVMFASDAGRLTFQPENGMKVIAEGRVSVFERDGVYQLYVRRLLPDGEGALAVAFEQLKKKLAAEGLFDPAHKKPLPAFPRRIGVVTSPGGAALQDVLKVLRRRYPLAEVILAGVTVQGASAPGEITAALKEMNEKNAADVILLVRGGGSAEDLWCFNDEGIARAVYNSRIPVVSGVGHEVDTTIADLVADLRAPTPSAAAEMAAPDLAQMAEVADALETRLHTAAKTALAMRRSRLELLRSRQSFASMAGVFAAERRRVETLQASMLRAVTGQLSAEKTRCTENRQALSALGENAVRQLRLRLTGDVSRLKGMNPLDVLLRGYAAVYSGDTIVSSAKEVAVGDTVEIRMCDGGLVCDVKEKRE
ncbi:MAG: exodeoxyribonuclease VII large subunit [Clostridia bacterium]|nr:exodeoxyribonuclease VII large subunit [Clostridia bacterium]